MEKVLRKLSFNQTNAEIREDEDYLIVPVIAIVEGVVNGELAPIEEFQKSLNQWEGVPLPLGHPVKDGEYVLFEMSGAESLGEFKNVYVEQSKLKGELWLLKEKLELDEFSDVKNALDEGHLEVSTAYLAHLQNTVGEYDGVEYNGVQTGLIPDHLALLPNSTGACSWSDGCGAPRLNERKEAKVVKNSKTMSWLMKTLKPLIGNKETVLDAEDHRELKENEMSFNQITDAIYNALAVESGIERWDFWVADVFDKYFIFQDNEGKWKKREYTVKENEEVELVGDVVEVYKTISYVPINKTVISVEGNEGPDSKLNHGSIKQEGDVAMDVKEKATLLINCDKTKFTEEDREFLESQSLETLEKFEPIEVKANDDTEPPETPPAETPPAVEVKIDEEVLTNVVTKVVSNIMEQKDVATEKSGLVTQLSLFTNQHGLSKETLDKLDIESLRSIAKDYNVSSSVFTHVGGPMVTNEDAEEIEAPPAQLLVDKIETGA